MVLYAVKKNLLPEAKATVEAYGRHQPQNADDRYRMELLITDAFLRAKDYASMTTHAKQMLAAAKAFAEAKKSEVFRRDEILLKSGVYLSEAYVKTNQKDSALALWMDLRRMAIALPSANLYKETTLRLMRLNPELDVEQLFDSSLMPAKTVLPEIVQNQIRSHIGLVTIGKLALFRIEQIQIPLPPTHLQRECVLRRAVVEKIRSKSESVLRRA